VIYLKLTEAEMRSIIAEHLNRVRGVEDVHDYLVEFATNADGRPIALVLLPDEKPVTTNPYPNRIAGDDIPVARESTGTQLVSADIPIHRESCLTVREDDAPYKRGTSEEAIATRVEGSAPTEDGEDEEEDEPAKTQVHRAAPPNIAADILGGGGSLLGRGQALGAGVGADRRRRLK
jgi:hypothetical protein